MSEVGKIVALCLIGIVLILLLQKSHPEIAILLALSICGGVLLYSLSGMKAILPCWSRCPWPEDCRRTCCVPW